jgi:hypothetical protein
MIEMQKFLKINYKNDKKMERLKNTVHKYIADIRPDRLTTCLSERKSVVSRRPGRAIAQAVSRRLPTAAARVQTRVWSCGIL